MNESYRILVVDDNPEIHADFEKVFSQKSASIDGFDLEDELLFGASDEEVSELEFQLESALQGEEGFHQTREALLAGEPFAVAFVDMRMPPGWDGLKTIRHILDADETIRIIICTAYTSHTPQQLKESLGCIDRVKWISKPFDTTSIRQLAIEQCKIWSSFSGAIDATSQTP